jgi:hypothetical protein
MGCARCTRTEATLRNALSWGSEAYWFARERELGLVLDKLDLASTGTFGRLFYRELHALALAEQFEHSPSHRTSVEEVLDPTLIANEAKALIDEESRNRTA